MKIALSASFRNVPAVLDLLKTCDVVFTTQWERTEQIARELSPDPHYARPVVQALPKGCDYEKAKAIARISEGISPTEQVQWITFGDLLELKQDAEEAARQQNNPA